MTLADAIRLGSMLSPQGFDGRMNGTTRCALSAAAEAAGIEVFTLTTGDKLPDSSALYRTFPVLYEPVGLRPCGCAVPPKATVAGSIWHLNDFHKWTREAIADWVEQIERAQEPQPADVEAVTGHGRY